MLAPLLFAILRPSIGIGPLCSFHYSMVHDARSPLRAFVRRQRQWPAAWLIQYIVCRTAHVVFDPVVFTTSLAPFVTWL